MNDGRPDTDQARPASPAAGKPIGLWILQGYFVFNAVAFAALATPLLTDPSFPYRASTAVTLALVVSVSGAVLVASHRKWRSARIVLGVGLALSLGMSLFGAFATLPPNPEFDQRKPEIRGAAEEAGANTYTIAALGIPAALLLYVGFSRDLRSFLAASSRRR